jgi:transcriptional regulator
VYLPKQFAIEDVAAAHEIMRQNSFATLVTDGPGGLLATHLPVLVEADPAPFGRLRAHVARANLQWQGFDGKTEALVIFQGQHGYISPSFYEPGPAVPTWDYVAVHAYGPPLIVDEPGAVRAFLSDLTAAYEARMEQPWTTATQEPDYLAKLALATVCFELTIERLEAKAKLGQNHPEQQERVAAALDALGAKGLAAMIREANGIAR